MNISKDVVMIVNRFCEFIYEVPPKKQFTLTDLQGGLRGSPDRVPDQQKYESHLKIAIEEGFIEPVSGAPDTYCRIGRPRSAYERSRLQELKDKMSCRLEGREWLD